MKLGEIFTGVQNGFACGERDSDGIIQLRMNNLNTTGKLLMDEYLRIPKKYYSQAFELSVGDILFNHTNSAKLVGKSLLFSGYPEPITFSNHFIRIRVDETQADPKYVFNFLLFLWQKKYFENHCDRWIGQAAFQPKKLAEIEIILPPLDEQRRIATEIERRFAAVEKAKQAVMEQMKNIDALPAAILRQALSGRM